MASSALSFLAFAVTLFFVQVPQSAIPTSDVLPADELLFDDEPIQVIVDMDSKSPGIQSIVQVSSCTTIVHDLAIYILDPLGGFFSESGSRWFEPGAVLTQPQFDTGPGVA